MAISEARKKANEKWKNNNKDKQRKYQARSTAKKYILDYADENDLIALEDLIKQKRQKLKG